VVAGVSGGDDVDDLAGAEFFGGWVEGCV
jgi:hypothetical protein